MGSLAPALSLHPRVRAQWPRWTHSSARPAARSLRRGTPPLPPGRTWLMGRTHCQAGVLPGKVPGGQDGPARTAPSPGHRVATVLRVGDAPHRHAERSRGAGDIVSVLGPGRDRGQRSGRRVYQPTAMALSRGPARALAAAFRRCFPGRGHRSWLPPVACARPG